MSEKAKQPSLPDFIRKMFGKKGEKALGTGQARRASKKLKGRKKKVDEAIKKAGG